MSKKRDQLLAIRRAAFRIAERGDLEGEVGEPERAEPVVADRDDLGVESGIVDADGFDTDLEELPVAAQLRLLGAEERARRTRA